VKWSKSWCFVVKIHERPKSIKIIKCKFCQITSLVENNVHINVCIKVLTESVIGQILSPEENI